MVTFILDKDVLKWDRWMESLGCTVLFTGRVIYMWARVLVWRSSDDSADEGKWSTDDV